MAWEGGLYGALALLGMLTFGYACIPLAVLGQGLRQRRERARHAVAG